MKFKQDCTETGNVNENALKIERLQILATKKNLLLVTVALHIDISYCSIV